MLYYFWHYINVYLTFRISYEEPKIFDISKFYVKQKLNQFQCQTRSLKMFLLQRKQILVSLQIHFDLKKKIMGL